MVTKMIRLTVTVAFIAATVALPALPQSRVDSTLNWKVVDGDDAPDGAFPSIVSLRGIPGNHFCAGVIIDENYVLTAAHCVDGSNPSDFSIVAGSNKLESGGTKYTVSRIIVHQDFHVEFEGIYNDIALLRTSTPIDFSDPAVAPVTLPTGNPGAGVDVILAGWGSLALDGENPNHLQYVNFRTVSNEECGDRVDLYPILEFNLCAFTATGQGVCHGDSGGPLVTPDNTLVGLVTWGVPCAEGFPDVYTRVHSFLDWISYNAELK